MGTERSVPFRSNLLIKRESETSKTKGSIQAVLLALLATSGGAPASTLFAPAPNSQYALSYLNTNLQYWMPGTTIFIPGTLTPMTSSALDGMVLHELLHNIGYGD